MKHQHRGRMRGPVGLILFVAAGTAVWWGLSRLEPRADWLRVEGPRRAVAGQPLRLRVHLAPLAEPTRLCADVHWQTARDTSMGCLATGGTQAVGKGGGTFDFEMLIEPRTGLRFVHGVVYLSRTGSWDDHTLVAGTEAIAVVSSTAAPDETRLSRLRVHPSGDPSRSHPPPAAIPRLLTGLLFLAAALVAWGAIRAGQDADEAAGHGKRWWQVLAVLLALSCLWELLGLEPWLGAQARAIAQTRDSYYLRAMLQKAVISGAIAATALLLVLVVRGSSFRQSWLVPFALYLAIAVMNLVSWHPIDKVAGLSWHGLTLVQALKLGCAAMALLGVRKAAVSHNA